jgi:hypothetical protein
MYEKVDTLNIYTLLFIFLTQNPNLLSLFFTNVFKSYVA